jgi:hypothetical protein
LVAKKDNHQIFVVPEPDYLCARHVLPAKCADVRHHVSFTLNDMLLKNNSLTIVPLAQTQHLFCLQDNLSRCSPVFEKYSLFGNRTQSRGLRTNRFEFDLNLSITRGG